jgi:organic radical activating enzyme
MSDCKEEDKFMDDMIFKDALKFMKRLQFYYNVIVVSGGEPMDHPKFEEYLKEIANTIRPTMAIIVCTNGLWICEHFDEFKRIYKETGRDSLVMWQITSVPEYYPIDICKKYPNEVRKLNKMKNVFVDTKLPQIYPQGRALENNLKWSAKGPKCFNIRSMSFNTPSVVSLLSMMSVMSLHCVPCIEYDGSIKMGESALCPACSHIRKEDSEIIQDIRHFNCKACKEAISQLPTNALHILN